MIFSQEYIIDSLRSKLSESRFAHSMSVAASAKELAVRYGCDEEKAYLSGILHDCAKQYNAAEMLEYANAVGIEVSPEESIDPVSALHARLSAYVASIDYQIDDKEILQAIEYHQSGGDGLTKFDKILGLADAIEPLRKGPDADRLRKIAETDLYEAYLEKHILYMSNMLRTRTYLPDIRVKVYNALISAKK